MEPFLYISCIVLAITTVIQVLNRFDFTSLKNEASSESKDAPLVSICIPARNEELNIERCLNSVLAQNYTPVEILVLDDNSTDQTPEIIGKLAAQDDRLSLLTGAEKPAEWYGKPWACHQLSEAAQGEVLVFLDADVWLEPRTIGKTVSALRDQEFVTVWPRQHLYTFWEKMIIPLIYHTLFSWLPARYVHAEPAWVPNKIHPKIRSWFAAACGQFMAFRKESYRSIGGHKAVQNHIVEDVALARLIKKHGHSMKMFTGDETVHCRMYRSHREIFNGLRKNFLAGFGDNIPFFVASAVLHLVVYVFPFFALLADSSQQPLALSAIGLIYLQRWLLDQHFRWNPWVSLLHPVSVLWYQVLGLSCLFDYFTGTKASWKGRKL